MPVKHHRHSLRFKDWKRKNTVQIKQVKDNYFLNFIYEKEVEKPEKIDKSLGIDLGIKKLLATSNGNFYGKQIEKILMLLSISTIEAIIIPLH